MSLQVGLPVRVHEPSDSRLIGCSVYLSEMGPLYRRSVTDLAVGAHSANEGTPPAKVTPWGLRRADSAYIASRIRAVWSEEKATGLPSGPRWRTTTCPVRRAAAFTGSAKPNAPKSSPSNV